MTPAFIVFIGFSWRPPLAPKTKNKTETKYTRAISGGVGFSKTAANYAAALYPAVQAQKDGFHQLIWTDGKEHKFIEESGTMNIFFVFNEQ